MSKRKIDVTRIVGKERADELERYAMETHKPVTTVLAKDSEMEYVGPDHLMAAFECEYCGNGYAVDLLKQTVQCPGCSASPTYEAIMNAIPAPVLKAMYEMPYAPTGSVTGSLAYSQMLGGIPPKELCRMPKCAITEWGDSGLCERHGGGAFYYGRPVTSDNYREIEKEEGKSIRALITEHGLKNWRP
jgi:hypothetical protein